MKPAKITEFDILQQPLVSEKSVQMMDNNKYCFRVHPWANKVQIKSAVETIFKVKVTAVNTGNYSGKFRRMGRYEGYKESWKKAIVTLKEGDKIEIFEGL